MRLFIIKLRKTQCKSKQYSFQHPGKRNSISKRKFIMSNIRIINGLLLLKTFYMNAIKPAWYFMHGLSLDNMRWGRNFLSKKMKDREGNKSIRSEEMYSFFCQISKIYKEGIQTTSKSTILLPIYENDLFCHVMKRFFWHRIFILIHYLHKDTDTF